MAQTARALLHALFEVEKEWHWSGTHYQRTALDWLANFDAHAEGSEWGVSRYRMKAAC